TVIGLRMNRALKDRRVMIHNEDARGFLKRSDLQTDVVLINLTEPSTLMINRYYSTEFFHEVKDHCRPGGVLSVSLPSTADYVSRKAGELNSVIYNTLKKSFRNVLIIPGQRNYFLASDSTLSIGISSLIEKRKIHTTFVNGYYLDDNLQADRSAFIMKHISDHGEINRDFKPVAFFCQLAYWNSMFQLNYMLIALMAIGITFIVIKNLNRIRFGLFTGGFTVASLEIMIILSLQVLNGYSFGMVSLIILVFMAGLAFGAFLSGRLFRTPTMKTYMAVQICMAGFAMVFMLMLVVMSSFRPDFWVTLTVLGMLSFGIATCAGIEFSLSSGLDRGDPAKSAGANYSADLYGGALGAMLTSVVLLPLVGASFCCIFLMCFNLISAFLNFRK
ncbi:MAG: hypothetical protein WCL00_11275, partial [Bacteroidota bacterium]